MVTRVFKYVLLPFRYALTEFINGLWYSENILKVLLTLHRKINKSVRDVKEAGLSLPQWNGIYLIAGKTTPCLLLEDDIKKALV